MLTEEIADAFVACLEEGRYYDAHEVLEALWFPRRFEKDPEVLLLKGMINAAVSFELRKRGRNERARVPWRTYEKYRANIDVVENGRETYRFLVKKIEDTAVSSPFV
jgi:hypothetical protein